LSGFSETLFWGKISHPKTKIRIENIYDFNPNQKPNFGGWMIFYMAEVSVNVPSSTFILAKKKRNFKLVALNQRC